MGKRTIFLTIFLATVMGCKTSSDNSFSKDIIGDGTTSICNDGDSFEFTNDLEIKFKQASTKKVCALKKDNNFCLYFSNSTVCDHLNPGTTTFLGTRTSEYFLTLNGKTTAEFSFNSDKISNVCTGNYATCDLDLTGQVPKVVLPRL